MKVSSIKNDKRRGRTAIIVVISIITVVALTASAFGLYRVFFSDKGEITAKDVFEDLKNLDVERLEDLSGVKFLASELSYTHFEEKNPMATTVDLGLYLSTINLHNNQSTTVFGEPSIGDKYSFKVKVNGRNYTATNKTMEIVDYHGKGTVEGNVVFDEEKQTEILIYLLPYFYTQDVSPIYEVLFKPDAIDSVVSNTRPEGSVVGGYCLVITSWEPLEEIEFVSVEKVV